MAFEEAALAKLKDRDPLVQSDAADVVFDAWFVSNTTPSAQALSFLARCDKPGFLASPSADRVVVREMMGTFAKIATILRDKPKFTALATGQDSAGFVGWLGEAVDHLISEAAANATPSEHRCEILKALSILLDAGHAFYTAAPEVYPTGSPVFRSLDAVVVLATNSGGDALERQAACSVVFQGSRDSDVSPPAKATILSVARRARDREGLAPIWRLGGARMPDVVVLLEGRIRSASQPQEAPPQYSALHSVQQRKDVTGKSALAGIPGVARIGGGASSSTGGASFVEELASSLHAAVKNRTLDMRNEADHSCFITLLKACDCQRSRMKDGEAEDDWERLQEVLAALDAALSELPDDPDLLWLALNPQCGSDITLETLATLQGLASEYSAETWTTVILPQLQKRISRMQLSGVSGDLMEQEVINFLRECGRLFYINTDRHADPQLGHHLTTVIVEAMRHGYIETEGFPRLCRLILSRHAVDGSPGWLAEMMQPTVMDSHTTARAVADITRLLLGLESTSAQHDTAILLSKEERFLFIEAIVHVCSTHSAVGILTDLIYEDQHFLSSHEEVLESALYTMQSTLEGMVFKRSANGLYLEAVARFLIAIAQRVTPRNASRALDVALRTTALSAFIPKAKKTYVASRAASESEVEPLQMLGDQVFTRLLDKFPPSTPPNDAIVAEALRVGGPATRGRMANLVPIVCLNDVDPGVRAQAFHALIHQPGLLQTHSDAIIAASRNALPMRGDGTFEPADAQVLVAAAPVLASMALQVPHTMGAALERLLEAARITSILDVMKAPDRAVAESIDMVAQSVPPIIMGSFLRTKQGLSMLPKLTKLRPSWDHVAQSSIRAGYIAKTPVIGYTKGSVDPGGHVNALLAGEKPVEPIKIEEPLLSDTQSKEADYIFELASTAFNEDDLGAALRLAHQLSPKDFATTSDGFDPRGVSLVRGHILPAISAKASSFHYDRWAPLMMTAGSLFPELANEILGPSFGIDALNQEVVTRFLERGEPGEARQWMLERGVRSPELHAQVDKVEFGASQRVEEPTSAPPAYVPVSTIDFPEVPRVGPVDDAWHAIAEMRGEKKTSRGRYVQLG